MRTRVRIPGRLHDIEATLLRKAIRASGSLEELLVITGLASEAKLRRKLRERDVALPRRLQGAS